MSTAPSLEPYLRARATDPSLIPSQPPRTARTHFGPGNIVQSAEADFIQFLKKLGTLSLSPITVPAKLLQQAVTSPLTISLVLKLILVLFLALASAAFSVLAVGAFWWSWGTGGMVEMEGWLTYGSRSHRTPHALIVMPHDSFLEDLRYDVQVEMELVRPSRGAEEMGNFMLSMELRAPRTDVVVFRAAQPSLPPSPLPSALLAIPSVPTYLLPPCLLPWPFRGLCPSRLFGYDARSEARIKERRQKGGFASPVRGKDVVLLKKELLEGVMLRPVSGDTIGSVFVSIGREDSFADSGENSGVCATQPREVRTTGWVVVRFIPRPTGIRWLLSSHPLPPLLILPPVSLGLTLSSSIFAFLIISLLRRPKRTKSKGGKSKKEDKAPMSQESLLAEKRERVFEERDREEKREAERRRSEWEEVESSALGGLRKMPDDKKRSVIASTIGGSETTAPTVRSFAPITEATSEDDTESMATETATEFTQGTGDHSRRPSDMSEWD